MINKAAVVLSAGMMLGACGGGELDSIPVSGDTIVLTTTTMDVFAEREGNYEQALELFTEHALPVIQEAGFVIVPNDENFLEDYSIIISNIDWPKYATQFYFETDGSGKIAFNDMVTGPVEVFSDQPAYNKDGTTGTVTDHSTPGAFLLQEWFDPTDPNLPIQFVEYARGLTVSFEEALEQGNINPYIPNQP